MSAGRVFAVVLRQFYLLRGSPVRLLPMIAWVAIDIGRQIVSPSQSMNLVQGAFIEAMNITDQILAALQAHAPGAMPIARLVHHADRAGDSTAVLRFAPAAAEKSSSRPSPTRTSGFPPSLPTSPTRRR